MLVEQEGERLKVNSGDMILSKVVYTLGVMPVLQKIIVCVEGEFDRKFLLGSIKKLNTVE